MEKLSYKVMYCCDIMLGELKTSDIFSDDVSGQLDQKIFFNSFYMFLNPKLCMLCIGSTGNWPEDKRIRSVKVVDSLKVFN